MNTGQITKALEREAQRNWDCHRARLDQARADLDRAIAAAEGAEPGSDAEREEDAAMSAHNVAEAALFSCPAPGVDAMLVKAELLASSDRSGADIAHLVDDLLTRQKIDRAMRASIINAFDQVDLEIERLDQANRLFALLVNELHGQLVGGDLGVGVELDVAGQHAVETIWDRINHMLSVYAEHAARLEARQRDLGKAIAGDRRSQMPVGN